MRVPSYITSFFQIYSNSNLVTGSLFNRLKGSDLEPYLQHLLSVSSDHYTFHTHRFILKIALHDSFVYFFTPVYSGKIMLANEPVLLVYGTPARLGNFSWTFNPIHMTLLDPPAVDEWVLLNRVPLSVLLSVCLSRHTLGIGLLAFNFGMVLETYMKLCVTELDFLKKNFFCPQSRQNFLNVGKE